MSSVENVRLLECYLCGKIKVKLHCIYLLWNTVLYFVIGARFKIYDKKMFLEIIKYIYAKNVFRLSI